MLKMKLKHKEVPQYQTESKSHTLMKHIAFPLEIWNLHR